MAYKGHAVITDMDYRHLEIKSQGQKLIQRGGGGALLTLGFWPWSRSIYGSRLTTRDKLWEGLACEMSCWND